MHLYPKIYEYWTNKYRRSVNNTLGLRIKFIREWCCKKCEEIKINKKINKIMKKSGYCKTGQNESTWGCDKPYKKKKEI